MENFGSSINDKPEEGEKEAKEGESKKAEAETQTVSAALTSGLREFPEVGGARWGIFNSQTTKRHNGK